MGQSTFPNDPNDAFAGKKLVARFAQCTTDEIRIPFAVGKDQSRTWIISKDSDGLLLKHDHRHRYTNPVRYNYYRWSCGRDKRLKAIWGDRALGKNAKAG